MPCARCGLVPMGLCLRPLSIGDLVDDLGARARLSEDPTLKHKVQTKFLEIWFSDDTDSKTKLCEELEEQLALLCSKNLFHDINERTKDPKLKVKAEMLLEALKTCLRPSSNAQIKASEKLE